MSVYDTLTNTSLMKLHEGRGHRAGLGTPFLPKLWGCGIWSALNKSQRMNSIKGSNFSDSSCLLTHRACKINGVVPSRMGGLRSQNLPLAWRFHDLYFPNMAYLVHYRALTSHNSLSSEPSSKNASLPMKTGLTLSSLSKCTPPPYMVQLQFCPGTSWP